MGLVWGNNLRENSRKHLKRTEAVGKGEEGSSHSVHESESKPRQTKFSVAALCPLCVFFSLLYSSFEVLAFGSPAFK